MGKRVAVAIKEHEFFNGVLRYVGAIEGKDGQFCGVELDEPVGKHGGSFQGKKRLCKD